MREDIEQYDAARQAFEKALASLQALAAGWEEDDRQRVQALTEGYARWKRLPPQLFELHEDTLAQPAGAAPVARRRAGAARARAGRDRGDDRAAEGARPATR